MLQEFIAKGGIILISILALSVVAIAVIIERLIYFSKNWFNKEKEDQILTHLRNAIKEGKFNEAHTICDNNQSPLMNLMKVGIDFRDLPVTQIKEKILDASSLEIPKMERFLSALGTIAHIAPLLGLLGTVTGNIAAFGVLGSEAAMGDPAVLAKGISEALITTAAGILVSIPATIFYNFFVNKVNHNIIRLEYKVNDLVNLLEGEKNAV